MSGGGGDTNDRAEYSESFEIVIYNPQDRTQFHLNNSSERHVRYRTYQSCFNETGGYGIAYGKSTDGEVIFTRIDSVAKIISGTFWCNIPTDKCDTLRITDGRFDIRYY